MDLGNNVYLRLAQEWFDDNLKFDTQFDETRDVLSVRCYPVRNLKTQIDFERDAPNATPDQPNYLLMADAFMFY